MVLVPYRGIYFLYRMETVAYMFCIWFSSPIGESIFSTITPRMVKTKCLTKFSSPIGESIFSTELYTCESGNRKVLVPYRGIYFLYPEKHVVLKPEKEFSSPIGESIFSTMNTHVHGVVIIGSRPLSGNLFSLLDTR